MRIFIITFAGLPSVDSHLVRKCSKRLAYASEPFTFLKGLAHSYNRCRMSRPDVISVHPNPYFEYSVFVACSVFISNSVQEVFIDITDASRFFSGMDSEPKPGITEKCVILSRSRAEQLPGVPLVVSLDRGTAGCGK